MYILFVDDNQERHDLAEKHLNAFGHTVLHSFTFDETVAILSSEVQVGLIMLDRDLGDFIEEDDRRIERNGHTIVKHIRENIPQNKWPTMAVVHSMNPEAKYMSEDLNKMGIPSKHISFSKGLLIQVMNDLTPQ